MRWILPIALCVIVFLASGQSKLAILIVEIKYFDKIVHFFIFGLLATAFYRIDFFWNLKSIGLILVLLMVAVYGVSDEVHQYFVPHRHFEHTDIFADISGALVALIAYRFWYLYRSILV